MKQRVRVQKSAAAEKTTPTNRLTDIQVDEVSIVDRAANQRKYLVVKNGKPQPGAAEPPALQLAADVKKKIGDAVQAAQTKLAEIAKAVGSAVETPNAELPKQLVDSCVSLMSDLAASCSVTVTQESTPTAKAGKKISAARLKLLLDAKTAIDAVISDGTEEKTDEPEKTEKNGEQPATEPKEPAKQDPPAEKPANDPTKLPSEPPPSKELEEVKETLGKLAGAVSKMTTLFEGQNARLDTLAKARGTSQQLDLDEQRSIRKNDANVAWPMDLAKEPRVSQ